MKIECDELLVICDNCGHAIHVKELDNNLIKLNNKNDKLISEQAAIDICRKTKWNGADDYLPISAKEIESEIRALPPAQPDAIPMTWIQEYADDWQDIGYAYENPIQGMLDDWRGEQDE